MKGDEVGVKLYTKQSVGCPKNEELSRHDLLANIKKKKYKFTFTDNNLKDDDLLKMIENKAIEFPSRCFQIIDNSAFNKIRNGLMEQKPHHPVKRGKGRVHAKHQIHINNG